jgi:hypothetical protein
MVQLQTYGPEKRWTSQEELLGSAVANVCEQIPAKQAEE